MVFAMVIIKSLVWIRILLLS